MPFQTEAEIRDIARKSRKEERIRERERKRKLRHERKLAKQKLRQERRARIMARLTKMKWTVIIILTLVAGILFMLKFG